MENFFIILMGFFIVMANTIGFIFYRKKKNLYFSAFIILLLAVLFGAIGGTLAIVIIRDPFAMFYGMQLGYYLMINSVIVFIIALLASITKKYNIRNIYH
ncbi:3-isopropylmalate dehydrogenase [Lysinibacillus cavernae]|uniref:3-isopropylmalate dehydrogenase n=1 Tax=Lysinibacillus cavernae TaxID=2666135 RepID=UPI0012D9A9C3|nr:3-isopropylmalate dehydrogenase [Lysinibacillus cavernae]